MQDGMPSATIPQVVLVFKSIAAISQFKHECACPDFYIDRDALTLVGSFLPEQVQLAKAKYDAVSMEIK